MELPTDIVAHHFLHHDGIQTDIVANHVASVRDNEITLSIDLVAVTSPGRWVPR